MDDSFIQDVYNTLSGFLIPEAEIPGVDHIFTTGQPALIALQQIYDAYDRIRERHHVNS